MPDNNLPPSGPVDTTSTPTEDQLVGDIADLLDDSPASANPAADDQPEAAPVEDDDPLGMAEDVELPDDNDDPDGPDDPEVKGGRFAPDTAKVLFNGETISIADLKGRVDKRVKEFQRGFTEKTTALSAREAEVSQYAQSLDQSREYLSWYASQHLPKQPGEPPDPAVDPYGFQQWQLEDRKWQQHVQAFQQFKADQEADGQRKAGETQKQQQERLARERDALMAAIPVLKDPVKGKQVWDNIVAGAGQHYGLTPEDVNGLSSSKAIVILRDALELRRIKASAKTVQAEVTKKPVLRDGRRTAPNTAQAREKQVRTERLRNSGSFEDGVAALQDFDL